MLIAVCLIETRTDCRLPDLGLPSRSFVSDLGFCALFLASLSAAFF
jgi:hypothetical protein